MLVGEAPGRQEDRRGEPFIGQAGRFLDELLALAGLSRGQVYITNVVKSRPFAGPPPGVNRAPAPQEIAACRHWLDEQLRIIRPQIIVALGRVALESFVPGGKISDVHGKVLRQGSRTIIPLYHPAVALHRPQLIETMKRDVRSVRRALTQVRAGRRQAARP